MAIASDYIAFADKTFELLPTTAKEFEFHFPGNVARDVPAILAFMLHVKNADSLTLGVEIRPSEGGAYTPPVTVAKFSLNGDYFNTVHEIVPIVVGSTGTKLNFARPNVEAGTLRISDVVLLYKVNL